MNVLWWTYQTYRFILNVLNVSNLLNQTYRIERIVSNILYRMYRIKCIASNVSYRTYCIASECWICFFFYGFSLIFEVVSVVINLFFVCAAIVDHCVDFFRSIQCVCVVFLCQYSCLYTAAQPLWWKRRCPYMYPLPLEAINGSFTQQCPATVLHNNTEIPPSLLFSPLFTCYFPALFSHTNIHYNCQGYCILWWAGSPKAVHIKHDATVAVPLQSDKMSCSR